MSSDQAQRPTERYGNNVLPADIWDVGVIVVQRRAASRVVTLMILDHEVPSTLNPPKPSVNRFYVSAQRCYRAGIGAVCPNEERPFASQERGRQPARLVFSSTHDSLDQSTTRASYRVAISVLPHGYLEPVSQRVSLKGPTVAKQHCMTVTARQRPWQPGGAGIWARCGCAAHHDPARERGVPSCPRRALSSAQQGQSSAIYDPLWSLFWLLRPQASWSRWCGRRT
jgi:hypothetical protein